MHLQGFFVMLALAMARPYGSARELMQTSYTDADIFNFALNLEYLQANFYSCGAYGKPVNNTLGGPTVLGCVKGNYSDAIQGIFENCAVNELDHVAYIQNALGSAAVPQPLINLTAVSAGANAAVGRELCCPPFSYAANDLAGMVTAFLFEDVGVTAYNGAAPLISDKTFLSDAISIGLIEAYHAGIVRDMVFNMRNDVDPYGIYLGSAIDAVSTLRGTVSAAASAAGNFADQGITIYGTENLIPSGAGSLAFARTPTEVLAIVYLGSASQPGGFFPDGVNGVVQG
ncbi:hypothetical protein WJX82_002687 [Trebouxia sp. C0006]